MYKQLINTYISKQNQPLVNFSLTWVIASLTILILHPPQILVLLLKYLCFATLLILFVLCIGWLVKLYKYCLFKVQVNSKLSRIDLFRLQTGNTLDFHRTAKAYTDQEITKLVKTPQFRRYMELHRQFGDDFVMCSPQTAARIKQDIWELKKLKSVIFDQQNTESEDSKK